MEGVNQHGDTAGPVPAFESPTGRITRLSDHAKLSKAARTGELVLDTTTLTQRRRATSQGRMIVAPKKIAILDYADPN